MSRRTQTVDLLRGSVFLLLMAVVAMACTSGDDSATTVPESSSSSTESTTTTEPATTTTSTTEPTSTTMDDEAAVRELHTRFMTEYLARDWREVSEDDLIEELETLAIDPQLRRSREFISDGYAAGQYLLGPGLELKIVSVEIDGDVARVVDCSQDLGELYGPAGDLIVAADDFHKLRGTDLKKIDGRWWISDWITGGDERCNPEDY